MKAWIVVLSFAAVGLTNATSSPVLGAAANPELKIGVRQRFGQEPKATLLLSAPPGDRLTVRFPSSGKVDSFTVDKLQVGVDLDPIQAHEEERLVISTHRSFESAEASANFWKSQGVEVELAQPENWQVWAKRERYDSTVSRLLLLQDLKFKGLRGGYLDRKVWETRPVLSWVINGYRFKRDEADISASSGVIQVDTKRYGGRLRFQPNAYGTFTLVNQVPLETYLRGVVPYEIGRQAPVSAIEAQAILARTYALRNLRRFKTDSYELCADTQCQVYEGLGGTEPSADAAVKSTSGQVLTYGNELIDALYSSTTGGVTAAFEDVWNGRPRPYLKAKIDAYSYQVWDLNTRRLSDEQSFRSFISLRQGFNESGGYFRWKTEAPLKQLNQNLKDFLKKQQYPLSAFTTIRSLTVTERAPGGRVQKLHVSTDLGDIDLNKDEVLRAFSAPNSLLFYVDPAFLPDRKTLKGFTFVGGGLGHGVGLSQIGSYTLSQIGWPAAKILSFYYPSTVLQPFSPSIVLWQDSVSTAQAPSEPEPQGMSLFGWELPKVSLQSIFNWFSSFGKPVSASLTLRLRSPYL